MMDPPATKPGANSPPPKVTTLHSPRSSFLASFSVSLVSVSWPCSSRAPQRLAYTFSELCCTNEPLFLEASMASQ